MNSKKKKKKKKMNKYWFKLDKMFAEIIITK